MRMVVPGLFGFILVSKKNTITDRSNVSSFLALSSLCKAYRVLQSLTPLSSACESITSIDAVSCSDTMMIRYRNGSEQHVRLDIDPSSITVKASLPLAHSS